MACENGWLFGVWRLEGPEGRKEARRKDNGRKDAGRKKKVLTS